MSFEQLATDVTTSLQTGISLNHDLEALLLEEKEALEQSEMNKLKTLIRRLMDRWVNALRCPHMHQPL